MILAVRCACTAFAGKNLWVVITHRWITHLKEMPKLGIWVLYIMSWILDEYPFEESLIMLRAALG